jgi:HK97 family phage prohead protease
MLTKSFALHSFKAIDDKQGIFEAIVAVFGNIDRGGDTILPGAFEGSLARWKEKARPIPVIFSHQWENLDAHIGEVLEAKEREEGLYVKAQLDMEEEFAARVWKRMIKGTLAEFSFAYDILQSAWVDRGDQASPRHIQELRELELLEVGPCLVGLNPETQLISVKDGGLKPYPNEHACRLRDPGDFQEDSFRRTTREHEGKKYAVIMGRLKGEETMTEQAYRYPTADWTADQARSHCRSHEGRFEAAAEKAGARHTRAEYEKLQSIHDMVCELGAKCSGSEGEPEDDAGDAGKSSVTPSALAARIAAGLST